MKAWFKIAGLIPLLCLPSGFAQSSDALWLQISGVSNGLAHLNLNNATDSVYEIRSQTDLTLTNWNIESEVWPTNPAVMPFTLLQLGRTNLFIWARDWTGITSNGNQTPNWWFWKFFGTTALSDTNLDSQGNTLLFDYLNGLDPNVIQFKLSVTNGYINTSLVPVQISVGHGIPGYFSVLDSTNLTGETDWISYVSSNIVVDLNLVEGVHQVWIGLRGLTPDATQTWHELNLTLDTTPPAILITNPATRIVSQPMIQLGGLVSENLGSLTFDLSNAAGIFANQPGYASELYYDTNLLAFTTNSFQCYDVALASGLNLISIHATDLAGNQSTATLSLTLDYSGDTTPPVVQLVWPQNGTAISSSGFTIQAKIDDLTALVTAMIVDSSGNTNKTLGQVQRNGQMRGLNLPLAPGTNYVTLTATDVAGNQSSSNITVFRSTILVTVNPLAGNQLNQSSVNITGTVSDPTQIVLVNNVVATVDSNGVWFAINVPVRSSGLATINVQTYPAGSDPAATQADGGQQFVQQQPTPLSLIFYEDHRATWVEGDLAFGSAQQWIAGQGGTYDFLPYGPSGTYSPNQFSQSAPDVFGYCQSYYDSGRPGGQATLDYTYTKERYALDTDGEGVPGTAKLYRVLTVIGGWNGTLPFDKFTIQGKPLVNSGITNYDGTFWGERLITAWAGTRPDVTPIPISTSVAPVPDYVGLGVNGQNLYYDFELKANEVMLQLAVDANLDGSITFDSQDQTSATNYYRFWINNDRDDYDSSISDYDDLEPVAGMTDDLNISIPNTRDLEDYTRLWINTQGITSELQNGAFLLGLEWKDPVEDPEIQLFQSADTNGSALYLTDADMAAQQVNNFGFHIIERAHRNLLTKDNPFIFPTSFWSNLSSNQPVAHLLFDAVSRGSGQLVISIYKNDGITKLAESQQPLFLKLQDVKEMYERWTVGDGNGGAVATTASLSTRLPSGVSTPFQYTSSSPEENNYILFVHGWNLAPWERDAFAETALKRLYWQGYKGRFGAFQWPTTYGVDLYNIAIRHRDFDNGESNAWASARGLLNKLIDLNASYSGNVYLMAHSQGNVVAGEALKLANSQVVNTYVAMQGAVPAHCYDPNTPSPYSNDIPDFYAHYWTGGSPCYFDGSTGAGTYVNFANTNDWALTLLWVADQSLKPDSGFFYGTVNGITGFFSGFGSGGPYPFLSPLADRYTIFSYCDPAPCRALGAQLNVDGNFAGNQVELDADSFNFGKQHKDHSGEFNSDNMNRWQFWNTLLYTSFGITR